MSCGSDKGGQGDCESMPPHKRKEKKKPGKRVSRKRDTGTRSPAYLCSTARGVQALGKISCAPKKKKKKTKKKTKTPNKKNKKTKDNTQKLDGGQKTQTQPPSAADIITTKTGEQTS